MYTNLHAHTIFSPLDGHATIKEYVSKVKQLGHTHAAITDHGTMAGVPDFVMECQNQGIIPIVGMEAYVEPEDATARDSDHAATNHLTMLAYNAEGYKNLMHLSTFANSVGFYRKPRIDHGQLTKRNSGLVILSGCTSSEFARHVITGDLDGAKRDIDFYRSVFGDRYFLELQDHGDEYQEQRDVNEFAHAMAQSTGLLRVATNDSHFCNAEDHEAQKLLTGIKMGQKLTDVTLGSRWTYVRDNQEMLQTFGQEFLDNTLLISSMVESYSLGSREPKLPISPLEVIGETPTQTLIRLVKEGLAYRLGDIPAAYKERFDVEINVIQTLSAQLGADFSRYLLMIADITNYCRKSRIRFGPRGSAAGSLVCWALRISEPDPIKDGLYFERFLNPFRVELPDVDLDFADDRREEVFGYLRETYGEDNVSKIGTYSMIGPRQAIKDASKSLRDYFWDYKGGYLSVSSDLIEKIPADPRPGGIPLHELVSDPDGKGHPITSFAESDENINRVLQNALKIEGRARGDGMHAAGVVVSNTPIADILPLMWTREARERKTEPTIAFQTQYEMTHLEKLGLLKVDILGLKTLSILDLCLQLIGGNLDPWEIPWDDEKTWNLIKSGKTLSLFQIGADGLSLACNHLQPNTIEDLALTVAVYRPGPMQNFKEIVNRKNNGAPIEGIHPSIDPILEKTYGFPIYQEQVMEVARTFAGYSLGEADLLRKAMGKKIREKMAAEKIKFDTGALSLGHSIDEADAVWGFLVPFADYGFNRAHAICYAYVAYQTAWLKANYPQEFYTAALTIESSTGSAKETPQQRIGRIIREARSVVKILPPDINHPQVMFTMEGNDIRYGLGCIKDVGLKEAQKIVDERKKGEFLGLGDFVTRCTTVRRSGLEALALVGALPWYNRKTLTEPFTLLGPRGGKTETTRIGQLTIERSKKKVVEEPDFELQEEYNETRMLLEEQSRMGMFNTPLPEVDIPFLTIGEVRETDENGKSLYEGMNVVMFGVLTSIQHKVTKKNQPMGYARLLDESDSDWELVIFPKNYELIINDSVAKSLLVEGQLVHVSGKINTDELGNPKMFLDSIWRVQDETPQPINHEGPKEHVIYIDENDPLNDLTNIYKIVMDHPGKNVLTIQCVPVQDVVSVDDVALHLLRKRL